MLFTRLIQDTTFYSISRFNKPTTMVESIMEKNSPDLKPA